MAQTVSLSASPRQATGKGAARQARFRGRVPDRKSTRLNSSHITISYAVFCLKKKKSENEGDGPVELPSWERSIVEQRCMFPPDPTPPRCSSVRPAPPAQSRPLVRGRLIARRL